MTAMNHEQYHDLIPAYAIGALDDHERALVEAWLLTDPEAQALLADYEAAADHMVALVPMRAAPPHLRDDLRQRIAANPTAAAAPDPAPARAASRPARRLNARIAWGLLAAAMFAVVILAALLLRDSVTDEPDTTPDAAALYAQLMQQSGASMYTVVAGEVVDTVSGDLVVSPDGAQAVLRLAALPSITPEETFQMWLIDQDGARTSGGLFQADAPERMLYVRVPLERPINAYRGVGVSLEPAGGSPYADQPTGPRVLSVPLAQ